MEVKSSKYAYVDSELLNSFNFKFFGLKKKKRKNKKFLVGEIPGWRNYMGKGNFDFCVYKP
jgi:hypothetical protein